MARRVADGRRAADPGDGLWRALPERAPGPAARDPRFRRRGPAAPGELDGGGEASAASPAVRGRRLPAARFDQPAAVTGRLDLVRDWHAAGASRHLRLRRARPTYDVPRHRYRRTAAVALLGRHPPDGERRGILTPARRALLGARGRARGPGRYPARPVRLSSRSRPGRADAVGSRRPDRKSVV